MLEMEEMIDFTEKRQKYEVGNRNNFIKLLSDNCSNHGINKSKVLEFCLNKFVEVDFDEYEIMITIENSYEKKSEYFGSWKNRLNKEVKKKLELKNKSKNKIKNTEIKSKDITFKDSVFQEYYDDLSKSFPEKYFNFISSLKSEREKDILIRRYGLYGNDEHTQKEIAKTLHISRSYVSRIEKRALTKILREFIKNNQID
jgi:RNA polymerase sigma factor (sigma-70 family)